MSFISGTKLALQTLLDTVVGNAIAVVPGIIAALVVLLFGYIIGAVVGHGLRKLLEITKVVDRIIERAKLSKFMGKLDLNNFFGIIVKWYIFILFMSPAADLIQLYGLSNFLANIANWMPHLIAAIILMLFSVLVGEYANVQIRNVKAKGTALIGMATKVVIILFAAIIALDQIGVAISLASNLILIVVGGIMLALALAVGIGFGIAMQEEAKGIVKNIRKKL